MTAEGNFAFRREEAEVGMAFLGRDEDNLADAPGHLTGYLLHLVRCQGIRPVKVNTPGRVSLGPATHECVDLLEP
jgi:hypothetical protein